MRLVPKLHLGTRKIFCAIAQAVSRNRYPFPHLFGPIPPLRLGKYFSLSKALWLGSGRNDRSHFGVDLNKKCSNLFGFNFPKLAACNW